MKLRELHGKIVRHAFQRTQRGKLRGQIRRDELIEMLGPREIAQAMLAQVTELHARRQMIAHQFLGGQRDQHLAAMGRGEDARHAIQRLAEVVAIAMLRRAGVQRHAHFQCRRCRPSPPSRSARWLSSAPASALCAVSNATQKASPMVLKT